ncbi:glycosyltransferase family 1 protein, partial [Acinetobacter sp. 163]|nr:glycosyltransferase family 1 protein [Acinetobacter sp. 163]
EYKAFIPINISYPLAYYVAISVPEKTLLIPTMHYESSTFRAIYSKVFTRVAYIGFNTGAEQSLAEHIFSRKRMSAHGIISVGIEQSVDADWKE